MFRNNILNGVTLLSLFFFFSIMTIPACDFASDLTLQEWLDSLNDPDPVVIDTCEASELHEVSDPAFISMWVQFQCEPDSVRWYVGNQHGGTEDLGDMIMALNPFLDTVEVYESPTEVAVIIDGTMDKDWIEGHVAAVPSCHAVDHLPRLQRQALYLGDALTFDEWMGVMDRHPSNSALNMRNSLTQEQKNEIWMNNLDYDSCKIAPTFSPLPNRVDFRFDDAPQIIRDRYKERKWDVVE